MSNCILRDIYNKDGIKLDARWFYDKEKNCVMWVFSEQFFDKTKEDFEKIKAEFQYAAFCYCEICDELTIDFSEYPCSENKKEHSQH